jgi:hypothetical protein
MRKIPLTRGKFALVSDARYKKLMRHKWNAHRSECGLWTAQRRTKENKIVYMHREIMGLKHGDKREVDHHNHDDLDNQDHNLRICTRRENVYNTRKQKRKTSSRYKGVSWNKQRDNWRVRITVNGKEIHLGFYHNEINAAKAYDEAAKKYYGEFACGNFI